MCGFWELEGYGGMKGVWIMVRVYVVEWEGFVVFVYGVGCGGYFRIFDCGGFNKGNV